MSQSSPPGSSHGVSKHRRRLTAAGLVAVVAAAALGLLSLIPGLLPAAADHDPARLTSVLARTIETQGIDAAAAQYRALRAEGFPGLQESEADTNTFGYALLAAGRTDHAIRIFQLNVETYPASANVYDSLGEAYLVAGERALAISYYEQALARDPKMKSAAAALQELTGRKRPPYSPLVWFHIVAGLVGILSGAAAMVLRKGGFGHSLAGRAFAISMLGMAGAAAYIAAVDPEGEVINVLMGVLTIYLVATAWVTAARHRPQTGVSDWIGLAVVIVLAAALGSYGMEAANIESGTKDGVAAGIYFAFAAVAAVAALLDVRMLRHGGVSGASRLTRHLWRMCTALFVAVTSFFLGQPQVFPAIVGNSGVLAIPSLLVLLGAGFWLLRVNGFRWAPRARQTAPSAAR